MAKQPAFFLNKYELLKKEHPEKFEKKRSSSGRRSSSGTRTSTPKVFDCTTCGMDKICKSGRLLPQGRGGSILIVGGCPNQSDDARGVLFHGTSGKYFEEVLESFGISFHTDCVHTNVVQCAPCKIDKRGRLTYLSAPSKTQIKCCAKNLEEDIKRIAPSLIICLGSLAMKAVLAVENVSLPSIMKMNGKVIPSHKYNCWVGCSLQPAHILRDRKEHESIFINGLYNILSKMNDPLPAPLTMAGNVLITDSTEAIHLLEEFSESKVPVAFDYETNCLSSHDKDAKLLTVALSNDVGKGYCIHLENPEWTIVEQAYVYRCLKQFLMSDAPKVVQNYNMEELWSRNLVGSTINNFMWDTMISTHVINCKSGTTGLAFQVYELTGHEYKEMVDVKHLEDEPIRLVADYNCLDARYTLMLYYHQKKTLEELDDKQLTEFNSFYIDCSKPLANFKDRGMRIDCVKLDEFHEQYEKLSNEVLKGIQDNPGVLEFEKVEEKKFNLGSPKQLGKVLYDIYKMPSVKKTKTSESTDDEALKLILAGTKDKNVESLISSLLRYRKITGFLARITQYKDLTDDNGFIHPTYTLNIAESFRSSAVDPNSQNIYKRDKELIKFRKVIVPSPGNVLLECDCDAMEVKVIAMASKDKNLTKQILEGVDPHKKWASEIYQRAPEDFKADERYKGKNGFVFPSFYGSVPSSIARTFPDISSAHISKTQEYFWKEYSSVKEWQNQVLATYKSKGYVRGLSGFKRPGPLSTNQLYNTPIQGSAFHLVLDGLKEIDREMRRRGMKSVAFMEVHDSILFDACVDEVEELIDLVNGILCVKRFEWQGVIPISISWEIGENFLEMEKI